MEQLKITIKTVNLQKKHLLQMPGAGLKEMKKGEWLCWVKTDKGSYFVILHEGSYYILRKEDWVPSKAEEQAHAYTFKGTMSLTFKTKEDRDKWLDIYKTMSVTVDQVYI
ncbi:MAG: hypothetical protein WC279_12055 [Sulfurimonas sp.]|jgi:hypothetical protein|uniref:hypothetical protein n=1 Tax=Sulfurimonas sp. TaxID=2022749 RepID=UPI003561B336